jgi:hypothetical protein
MIECIFTLDYEIYGNGTGALKDVVYEPGEKLREIFHKWEVRFVAYIEAAEFAKIDASGTDCAIDLVKSQIRDYYQEGFEIGLHLHPQWCNARYENGAWALDYNEYNLCTLNRSRILEIVGQSLDYLRQLLGRPDFTPLSFRAGNWLFQPTETAAGVLSENGLKLDSSVFKGGLQHNQTLDYRDALENGYYWKFKNDVTKPEMTGPWIEVPIHTEMVPFWKMPTSKRLSFNNPLGMSGRSTKNKINRVLDLLRFLYPLKLDFCRMTLAELTSMVDRVIREDRKDPRSYRPLVAIGHTKDLSDPQTVDAFLSFLRENGIAISTFKDIYPKLLVQADRSCS